MIIPSARKIYKPPKPSALTEYDSLKLYAQVRCSHSREYKIHSVQGRRWR